MSDTVRKTGAEAPKENFVVNIRAVAIRFGVVRLVRRAQERYTLGGPGGMLTQENLKFRGYEIVSETNLWPIQSFSEARRHSFT